MRDGQPDYQPAGDGDVPRWRHGAERNPAGLPMKLVLACVLLVWLVSSSQAKVTSPPVNVPITITGGGGGVTPVLIQHIASSANPAGNGISGNNFKIPLQPTLAGDCLVLGISYQHGQTITIKDNKSETWPAAAAAADGGSGNQVAAVYVMPNVAAGVSQLTVSANTVMHPFAYRLSEFTNCGASSPVNGTNAVANIQATPAI